MTDALPSEELNDLAAEYALGVLGGEERLRAQALQRSDPAFAKAVEMWHVRLAPLLREVAELPAGDHVWSRISGRIEVDDPSGPKRSARRWRMATFVTGALAASLAVVALLPRETAAPAPSPTAAVIQYQVAQLVDAAGKPLLAISYDERSGSMKVGAASLGAQGRVPELWVIPRGGKPHSLGELTADGSTRVIPPDTVRRLVRDGATLAITLERREGIPHAAPTGAIVASGMLTTI